MSDQLDHRYLRNRLDSGGLLIAPGAYDGLTAKIIEEAGFEAVYMTGYGTAASWGLPDLGLLTMTDMVQNAARIAQAVNVPVIADADTGYGNEHNVGRTVQQYAAAGVAAIHIEDQVWPKKCGHMEGKKIIPSPDMVAKISAAVAARPVDDFLIIARTDAIAVEGFDAAIERAKEYSAAGADVLFVEAPESLEQVAAIPERVPGVRHLINLAPKTPNLPVHELEQYGYAIAIYPGICLTAVVDAARKAVGHLKEHGATPNAEDWRRRFKQLNAFLGADQYS